MTREQIAEIYIDDQLKPEHRSKLKEGLMSAIRYREQVSAEKMYDLIIEQLATPTVINIEEKRTLIKRII